MDFIFSVLGIIFIGFAIQIGWLIVTSVLTSVGRGLKKVVTGKETYFGPAEI